MPAKRFSDVGFRLACLDALFCEGKLKRDLARVLKIPHPADDVIQINKDRLKAFRQIPLTPSLLETVSDLGPDGGDDIYPYVIEHWNGTQSEVYIKSFRDLKLLPNLKRLWVYAVTERHALDLSLLAKHKKLEEVCTDYFYLSREIDVDEAVRDLKARGVSVRISGKP